MPANDKEGEKKDGSVAIPVTADTTGKASAAAKKKKNANGKADPDEVSEEDKALKEGLELAVLRLQEPDKSLHKQALEHLSTEIRSATSSMTSVPKPLKFLRLTSAFGYTVGKAGQIPASLRPSVPRRLKVPSAGLLLRE